jgi:hypothetical protein
MKTYVCLYFAEFFFKLEIFQMFGLSAWGAGWILNTIQAMQILSEKLVYKATI